jgi:phosphoglycerate dehydrogenase-like enzyme
MGDSLRDVFAEEPLSTDSPLLNRDNVILTPHLAFYTREAFDRLERACLNDVRMLLSGEFPPKTKYPEVREVWETRWS